MLSSPGAVQAKSREEVVGLDNAKLLTAAGAVVSAAALTVNVWVFDVPPPGVVLKTVMEKVPAVVRSPVRIAAVN